MYTDALERFARADDLWGIARASADLAYAVCDAGDYAGARSLLSTALTNFIALDHKRGIARILEGFAYLAQSERDFARALRLAGAAAAFRDASDTVSRPLEQAAVDRAIAPAWQSCARDVAQQLFTAGRRMPLQHALDVRARSDHGRHASKLTGSRIRRTAATRSTGKPALLPCSRINSSWGAQKMQ